MSALRLSQLGISKFEFAVVVAILGVLAAVLLDRLIELERQAERLEVELTVRNLQTGLRLAVSEKIIRGQEADIATLYAGNPLDLLGLPQEPPGKVGAGTMTPRWQYDPATHILSYRPRQPAAFAGRDTLAWRLVGYRDAQGRVVGLRVEPLP